MARRKPTRKTESKAKDKSEDKPVESDAVVTSEGRALSWFEAEAARARKDESDD